MLIDLTNDQVQWERGSTDRGVRRYRESLFRTRKDGSSEMKELAELEPGMEIMREVIVNAEAAVKDAQVEAMNRIRDKERGRWEMWWWPLCCLDADKIALIGTRSILGSSRGDARPVRSVALEIGRHMKLEREFEDWKDAQNRAERKRKEEGQDEEVYAPNWWKLMRQRAPELSERAFRKWAKKSGSFDKADWGRDVRLGVGTKVLDLIVKHGGGWFAVDLVAQHQQHRYTTERRVFLTEQAKNWVKKEHRGHELNRPWLLPMLQEPQDWKRKEPREDLRVGGAPDDARAGADVASAE